jgi:hypothetical protein
MNLTSLSLSFLPVGGEDRQQLKMSLMKMVPLSQ